MDTFAKSSPLSKAEDNNMALDLEPSDTIAEGSQVERDGTTKRGLKSRHIQLIALGGTIGTGLFVGSGQVLAISGPASLLMSYIFMSIFVWVVVMVLGEMTSYLPVQGMSVPRLIHRFAEPSLAFAAGWNYWYAYSIIPGAEATAVAVVIEYWTTDVHPAVWITIVLIVTVGLNLFAVAYFGEAEFWFASIKIIAIIGLIMVGFVLCLGGGPDHDRLGFRYWVEPGAFNNYLVSGSTGEFLGFWHALVRAGFSYILSPEFLCNTAGECQAPQVNIPKASRRYIYRLFFFYILSALVIGILVPWNNPRLFGSSNASASPFVIGIQNASIPVLNHIINAVILTAAWSAGNSLLYAGSRILYGMACEGNAPKIFRRCNRWGVPYIAVLVSSVPSLLAYLTISGDGAKVFNWLTTLAIVSGFMNWVVVLFTYLRFRKAAVLQGVIDNFPLRAPFQPYAAYIAMFSLSLITLTNGFAVFFPGRFNAADFITSYIPFPIFAGIYIGHRVWTKGAGLRKIEDLDMYSGLDEVAEVMAQYTPVKPKTILHRVWYWLC